MNGPGSFHLLLAVGDDAPQGPDLIYGMAKYLLSVSRRPGHSRTRAHRQTIPPPRQVRSLVLMAEMPFAPDSNSDFEFVGGL
eukprot:971150-Alexandrium_andersonii.AAC.1